MINWLKYYFLGFFSDRLSKESSERSALNMLLSLLMTLLLLSGGLAVGHSASFGSLYSGATQFREFLYSAFASEDGAARIGLKVAGGKLSAEIPDGDSVNGFAGDDGYSVNGYKLVVDTRPAATTYDDFTFLCKDAGGNEISYEEYRNLADEEKQKSSATVVYSGKTLDTSLKKDEYTKWLGRVSDSLDGEYDEEIAAEYAALNEKYSAGETDETEYCAALYILYAKSYYPSFSGVESYGEAPTLRTYYLGADTIDGEDRYIILLDNICLCSFGCAKGFTVSFGSYYTANGDKIISSDQMTSAEIKTAVDCFIKQSFSGSFGINFFIYMINFVKYIIMVVLMLAVSGILLYLICRALKLDTVKGIFGGVKTVGSFMFIDAVLCFVVAVILSFMYSVENVFNILELIFAAVLALRAIALVIADYIRSRRERSDGEGGADGESGVIRTDSVK